MRPPRHLKASLKGAYLNCTVVGTGEFGDPIVQAYGNGTKMCGFLTSYPHGIATGQHVKVRVNKVKERKGVPHSFAGHFQRFIEL